MTTPGPVAIIGGTGPQGRGLGYRLARAAIPVVLGSRSEGRAAEAAASVCALPDVRAEVQGLANLDAAASAPVVILVVPYEGHRELIVELAPKLSGRTVISCVNPLGFDKQGAFPIAVPEGSAAQQAAALAPDARVVAAFHHVSAVLLADLDHDLDIDIMVLGDDREATDEVIALADRVPGMRGVYAGRLRNAAQVESLTANLISINRRYKVHAGIRVTDLP